MRIPEKQPAGKVSDMSYCVHCGVKLADGAASCPLCGTPVLDPNRATAKAGASAMPMFSERDEDRTAKRINPRFVAKIGRAHV